MSNSSPLGKALTVVWSFVASTFFCDINLAPDIFRFAREKIQKALNASWQKRSDDAAELIWDQAPGTVSYPTQTLRREANVRYLFRRQRATYGEIVLERIRLTDLFVVRHVGEYYSKVIRNSDGGIVFDLDMAKAVANDALFGTLSHRMLDPQGLAAYDPSVHHGTWWEFAVIDHAGSFRLVWPGRCSASLTTISIQMVGPNRARVMVDGDTPGAIWPVMNLDAPGMTDLGDRLADLFRRTEIELSAPAQARTAT